jgi:hypothetical protein
MTGSSRPRRGAVTLLAGLAATALVAGCGSQGGSGGAAAAPPSTASSSSSPAGSGLADGLLPASAFGSDATVAGFTLDQLRQMAVGRLGTLQGVQVEPQACAAVLQGVRSAVAGVQDLAGQSATAQDQVTVEAIATGTTDAVATLRSAISSCSEGQVTAPQGSATLTAEPVDVSSMGDSAAAVRLTATATPAGRDSVTVPALLGLVQDQDRLLLLATATRGGAAPDEAAFTSLLQKAYSTEQDALG